MTDYSGELKNFIANAFLEDAGDGDHSSLCCIPVSAIGRARLLIKQEGILSGVEIAKEVFLFLDPEVRIEIFIRDGTKIKSGDIAFIIKGKELSILKAERLVLNIMQRMSGIATQTASYVAELHGLKTKVLDTRKTTPGMRFLEKLAVKHGGGENHRMGLYDMILLKDNHIDYAGGLENAILKAHQYLKGNHKKLQIEVEARTIRDVSKILEIGGVQRILLDNFSIENTRLAVEIINGKTETESSGGITLKNLRRYAECGVDYISVGALTHQIFSLDMSLKAIKTDDGIEE
jgi:nicotinate-nucleotide pyrophosphorylase (carboxylating)